MQILQKSILENHRVYKYKFEDHDEAISILNKFRRYQRLFLSKYPLAKFSIDIQFYNKTQTLTVEVWIFPPLLMN